MPHRALQAIGALAIATAIAIVVCVAPLTSARAQDAAPQQPVTETAPAVPSALPAPTSEAVKQQLSKELGVPIERLTDAVDLVADLKLDQGVVYYAVQAVFDTFKTGKPAGELTKVGDIVAAVAPSAAPAPSIVRKRSFTVATTTSYVQTVFYLTDRKSTGEAKPELAFGGERAVDGAMSYGRAEVNIPYSHKPGQIETPWMSIEKLRDAGKHIFIIKLDSRDEAAFFSEISSASDSGDVLVYIHGFNVRFEDALVRAAQISFDFGFKGAPVVFSWPSWGSLTAYASDAESALWSAKHLERFLQTLSEQTQGRKIHLVAHSMGSKVLLNAMRLMAYSGKTEPMFASVILCAPDFDAGMFKEQVAAEIHPLASQWVIYSSNKDIALTASEQLNAVPRLGKPVTYAEGYEIIDASELEVTPWSVPEAHSYYATKKVVLDDMVKVISGLAASARGLKSIEEAGGTSWTFDAAAAAPPPP
jgi:esterase/lipase superfamily enzyme